ncbi:AarF/ABC1/UbiB kinase family protein [Phormidium sp. FACHB-592]|uniref:AarF/ABC1/UbiB kinase family protein n=1 Tax=Stenomitos frigidus AS-A4 TaxID=2933935 RepID=A0ABV0KJE6_9CYAN|nr:MULTISPECIES: AarF/ABC1/UbiB kinase family protein [Cyanophyceae]MBD2037349.1 AarF/ABC1/UbiB kinase family protein [Leptolyngbya sp. FACHB-321]MBD2073804.1 AarF/ABC1/UbiB kinase family protein [Phormidium sp. FACHB-592]
MFSRLAQSSARQREIAEVVLRNGWGYMRRLLTGTKAEEPQLPPPAVLRNILVELGPVYVKLGQLLSTRPDLLPPEYITALTALQAEVPPVSWQEVEVVIRQQLRRPLEESFTTINHQPVAAGSIAQTHRATLADGREVALKIQRPGIEAIVDQDIALIRSLADLVSRTNFGKYYDLKALAEEFATALLAELDFMLEATHTDQLRSNLSSSRWFDPKQLVVPEIYWELTTERLMVMEWLDGVPLLQGNFTGIGHGGDATAERRAIVSLLVNAFFQQIYIDGFFHADPHPGNLFYLRDGRVALLDCGMVGRLDPRTQQVLTEMLLAIVNLDAQRCTQLTLQLAESVQTVNLAQLESDYDRLLRRYFNLNLAQVNFSQLFYDILQRARANHLRVPGNMGLYAKTLANLESVARKLDPDFNLADQIKPLMTDLFRRQLVGEAPLQALLRTALDLKTLSLQSPRQLEILLDRVTSETLQWNLNLRDLDPLRRSVDDSANRLSFSIVVGALIMGAATILANDRTGRLFWVSSVLFFSASFLGLWLIVSILRSGRLR